MTFTDRHRSWIQACASRGCIPHPEALRMYEAIFKTAATTTTEANAATASKATDADLLAANEACNERLQPLGQQISVVRCAVRRQPFVVFTDSGAAAIMKSQTNVPEADRAYFALLLQELATADCPDDPTLPFCIDQMAAINLTNRIRQPRTITKAHAEELLAGWTAQGYFATQAGRLYFGPRACAEFGRFLHQTYPEHVLQCPLCQVPVFRAIRCDSCAKPYHKECLQKFLARSSKCPTCKRMWNVRLSQ